MKQPSFNSPVLPVNKANKLSACVLVASWSPSVSQIPRVRIPLSVPFLAFFFPLSIPPQLTLCLKQSLNETTDTQLTFFLVNQLVAPQNNAILET